MNESVRQRDERLSREISKRQEVQDKFNANEVPSCNIVIYICPTPGCGNYFGAPSFREDKTDLTSLQTKRGLVGPELSHARVDCPDCRARDNRIVEREAYIVTTIAKLSTVLEYATKSDNQKAVQVRSKPSSAEPRREVQESSRSQLSGRSKLRRSTQLRSWASKARNGVRLRRHQRGMESSD